MKKKLIVINLILLIFLTTISYADVGPKPAWKIHVVGMDTEDYKMKLIVDQNNGKAGIDLDNLKFEDFDEDPTFVNGRPIFGESTFSKREGNIFIHEYSYTKPSHYKVALMKKDGTVFVTEMIHDRFLFNDVTIDLRSVDLKVSQSDIKVIHSLWGGGILVTFAKTFILTFLIELILALGFSINEKVLIFYVNLFTQGILYMIMIVLAMVLSMPYFIMLIIGEIAVFTIEYKIYLKYITYISEKSVALYVVIANFITMVVGYGLVFL